MGVRHEMVIIAQNEVGCNGASTQPGLWHCHADVQDAHGCIIDAHMSSYQASPLISITLYMDNLGCLATTRRVAAPMFLPTTVNDNLGEALEGPLPAQHAYVACTGLYSTVQ